jgi:iron complex transport system substrate-binding protein
MKTRLRYLLTSVLLYGAMAVSGVHAEIVVVDATGAQIRLAVPAQRVVSLAPHITELVYAADAGSKLVGNVGFGNYPPALARDSGRGAGQSVFHPAAQIGPRRLTSG